MPFVNYFLLPFGFDACIAANSIVINLYAQDLGATPFELGMLGFIWGVCYSSLCIAVGRVSDRLPRRATMTAAMLCFAAAIGSARLASRPWHLYFMSALNGCSCAFFWPLFLPLLHDAEPRRRAHKMTMFNVGWTVGITAGSALGGYLMERGAAFAITAVALAAAALAAYFAVTFRAPAPAGAVVETDPAPAAAPRRSPRFLHMSWLANFTLFAASGGVYAIFPKLARELRFPDRAIGLELSVIVAAQALAFLYLCQTEWWRYRLWPLLAFQAAAAAGLALVATGSTYVVFACALAGLGLGRAMTYGSSLQYGIGDPARRARNMGVHESLIGAAFAVGPLLAGAAAQWFALRAAFWLGFGLVAASMAAQTIMHRAESREA